MSSLRIWKKKTGNELSWASKSVWGRPQEKVIRSPAQLWVLFFFFRKGFESKEDLVTSVSRIAEYTQTRLVWVAGAGVLREHMGEKEEPRELVGVTSGKVRAKESDQARSASGRSPRISSM